MHKLIHPQEIEVFYLLPALRREIAVELKKLGKGQKEIAKILGVSEPSVSHYFNAKRGADVSFDEQMKKEINKLADTVKTPQDVVKATQKLLKLLNEDKQKCKVCKNINKTFSKGCEACFD